MLSDIDRSISAFIEIDRSISKFISHYKLNTIQIFALVNSNQVIAKFITHRKTQERIETTCTKKIYILCVCQTLVFDALNTIVPDMEGNISNYYMNIQCRFISLHT